MIFTYFCKSLCQEKLPSPILCPVHYNSNMKYISEKMLSRKIITTHGLSGVKKSWKIVSESFKYFDKW